MPDRPLHDAAATAPRRTSAHAAGTWVIAGLVLAAAAPWPAPAPVAAAAPAPRVEDIPDAVGQRLRAWRSDLNVLRRELPQRHPDPFTRITRAAFDAASDGIAHDIDLALAGDADASGLPVTGTEPATVDAALWLRFAALVAMLGDGHTLLDPAPAGIVARPLPIAMIWLDDGVFIHAARAPLRAFIGARVLAIDDLSIDEALERVSTLFPWENESARRQKAPRWLARADVLAGLKIAASAEAITLRVETAVRAVDDPVDAGEPESGLLVIHPDDATGGPPGRWISHTEALAAVPLALRRPELPYWWEALPHARALYIKYNRCLDDPDHPFDRFVAGIGEAIDRGVRDGTLDRVIVDLRHNGGGNSQIAQPLIRALRERRAINRPGGLIVIIGRGTFSSAQLNAADFRRSTHAILIGEPTGQRPNAFGEIRFLTLPATGAVLQYSTKFFRTDPDDHPSMVPDIPLPSLSTDFFAGRDLFLETALTSFVPAPER
ncbi:MAG: hypothetical protein KF817_09760 [Phycisphaeraceae bacterium]|nr:hypothetical protein [Phycisphaeraceae bacterium]